jgi:hypothetical protein
MHQAHWPLAVPSQSAKPCRTVNSGCNYSSFGVSINGGAVYTNSPNVVLTVVGKPPNLSPAVDACARAIGFYPDGVAISNDGGLGNAQTFPAQDDQLYPWTLQSSDPERFPKTVYVRFIGGVRAGTIYTDDIVLDTTPPKIVSASIAGAATRSGAQATKRRTYKLHVRARDKTSGVQRMQIAGNRRRPGKLLPYKQRAVFKSSRPQIFVRVQDGAGNFSRWKRVRRPRR